VSAVPERLSDLTGWSLTTAQRLGFVLYSGVAVAVAFLYRALPEDEPAAAEADPSVGGRRTRRRRWPRPAWRPRRPRWPQRPQRPRRIVLELAALFSLDSAGGGLVVTSLLVLWLHLRFGLDTATTGAVFFAAGLLTGTSQLLAGPLAARIGLIRTMSFTHLPANLALALAAFAPTPGLAIGLLLLRSSLSQMDVPARQAFVMAVVPPEERAVAASITNVPRSLASAATPLLAGALLTHSTFGWPLLLAGLCKGTYDILLLILYRHVPETVGATRADRTP
jgi:MFS family permease